MAKYILAASPDTSFGETLRTGLQDTGGYTVQLAASGAEVLASIGNLAYDVAILDSLISDLPLPSLVDAIRLKHPDVKVLVIPPTDPFSELTLEECGADNFINKPVFIPDLLDIIRGLLKPGIPATAEPEETPFQEEHPRDMRDIMGDEIAKIDWDSDKLSAGMGDGFPDTLVLPLEDVIAETQPQISIQSGPKKNTGALQEIPPEHFLEMEELAKWFSESTARSAMLVRAGEVIATSGEMDGEVQRKFAREVSGRFQASEARELIRYIPPQQGLGSELLFSATIGNAKFLVLTYDAETSYSLIREQAERLRKRLADIAAPQQVKPEEVVQAWSAQEDEMTAEELPLVAEMPLEETGEPVANDDLMDFTLDEQTDEIPPPAVDFEVEETGNEIELEAIPAVMPPAFDIDADFPLPNTDKTGKGPTEEDVYPWLAAGVAGMASATSLDSPTDLPEGFHPEFPWEEAPVVTEDKPVIATEITGAPFSTEQTQSEESPVVNWTQEENSDSPEPVEKITTAELELKSDPQGGTRNLRVFLLVPADPRVFLTGKLAAELGEWIPQVCQTMNWEVDALAVRPEFVRVGLTAAPDQKDELIVGTLQDATTRRVASNYPQMSLDPEKPLFWADDFLRINPNDPPDQNELNAFIRHLRR
jgi:CheY-like chemotaxis protein/REP element-mobilizing transposase RayT